jgi:hypothetical protein
VDAKNYIILGKVICCYLFIFYANVHAFAALQAQNWGESLTNFHVKPLAKIGKDGIIKITNICS